MSPPALNGNGLRHDNENVEEGDGEELDLVQKLQRDLERTNEEKEQLATQYRNLLAKLTTMRTTLGIKLKEDAVRNQIYWLDDIANFVCLRRKNSIDENNKSNNWQQRTKISHPQ